tara:strand:- start:74 stop:274 length:201 start_codon:yes stop_codon:yes gene_type:complete
LSDTWQVRQLLSLAEIYDGGKRTKVARMGSVGLQVIRDWVQRFRKISARSRHKGQNEFAVKHGTGS